MLNLLKGLCLTRQFASRSSNSKVVRAPPTPPRFKSDESTWEQLEQCHNMYKTPLSQTMDEEYTLEKAMLIARVIADINSKASHQGASFAQNYIYQKGIKKFGNKGWAAASKELDQLHKRNCFSPIDVNELTPEEKAQAMEALMFLTEKYDATVKGRLVYNGKPTREWLSRDDSASPTAALESILLTAIIDAKEG